MGSRIPTSAASLIPAPPFPCSLAALRNAVLAAAPRPSVSPASQCLLLPDRPGGQDFGLLATEHDAKGHARPVARARGRLLIGDRGASQVLGPRLARALLWRPGAGLWGCSRLRVHDRSDISSSSPRSPFVRACLHEPGHRLEAGPESRDDWDWVRRRLRAARYLSEHASRFRRSRGPPHTAQTGCWEATMAERSGSGGTWGLRMDGDMGPRSRRPPPRIPACSSNARARARPDWVIQRQVNLEEILANVDKPPERAGRRRALPRPPAGRAVLTQHSNKPAPGRRLFLPLFRREPLRMCPRCSCCGRTSS